MLKLSVFKKERFFIFLPQRTGLIALWVKFEFYIDLHNQLSYTKSSFGKLRDKNRINSIKMT